MTKQERIYYCQPVFRPPSEAHSLILQVTVGCAHNKCTFCEMYIEKKFHIRQVEEVIEDIEMAKESYGDIIRKFFCIVLKR